VLSSSSVEGEAVDSPLGHGACVDEIFGLPPLLPLRVRWRCVEADREGGALTFESADGVPGWATDCKMAFDIASTANGGSSVALCMSYKPASPIARLAPPLLTLDNTLALTVMLPRAISSPASPLGTQDPIAGPLVAVGRALGLLPAQEEDGWTGEPSAWADADSLTQRLSAFSTERLGGFKQWLAERVAGDFDVEAVDMQLRESIEGSGVVLFSFTSCPFCKRAKELLSDKGAVFTVVELDEIATGAALRARLGARTGRTSVPSVWIAGEYVGGMNDGPGLGPLDTNGKLEPMLRAAGAMA